MFTLVICLVVVALSGAVVLHISLVDPTKRATPKHRQSREPGVATDSGPIRTIAPEVRPVPEPAVEPEPEREPEPEPEVDVPGTPSPVGIEPHRARSAGLLVLLLTTIGGVLAVAVALAAVAAAVALRAALVG
ncbi:hypothetical protein BH24ACT1_BH24ACT1_12950 [soil metagenome]